MVLSHRPGPHLALPRWMRPKALVGTPGEPLLGLVAVALLLGTFVIDQLTPKTVTVSSFAAVPVLLAAWLLSGRATALVAAVAVGLQAWLGVDAALAGNTVEANVAVILLMAVVGHRAAANSEEARAVRERQLRILLDIANRLNGASELQGALDDVAAAARRFVSHAGDQRAARGTVWMLEGQVLEAAAESDDLGVRLRGQRFEPGARLVDVLAGRTPADVPLTALGAGLQDTLRQAGVQSVAVAPDGPGAAPDPGP